MNNILLIVVPFLIFIHYIYVFQKSYDLDSFFKVGNHLYH